ncbi:hypothetical protein B0H19DRAFT_1240132 [Mycena capillaripes]|nr:hypothetical protein B0H19DRAFT_1240132 [Mycena capillaripes]
MCHQQWTLFLALTFFTSSSCALPIPIHTTTGPSVATCLAILAALSGLLLLVFLKRLYIHKSRRLNQARRQNSILSLPLGSASASVDSVPGHGEKAGFIVGFFGSPTVEIQCALDKAEWKENKQSSFTYQIHTESRRRRLDYPSVLDISRLRNRSVSTSPRALDKKPVLRESHSFKLPSFPDEAHVNSSAPPRSRRFSLPNLNRSVAHDSHRRRHSSLKSARSRRSVAFVPGSPSLRIVDSFLGPNTPLPLSLQLSEVSTTSPAPSSISASSPFSPKLGYRLSRSFIPPLPPLPFTSSPTSTAQRAGAIQISHPYVLSAHPRKNMQSSPPSQTDHKLQDQVRLRAPATDIDFIPLELPVHSPTLSPTLSSFPSPPPVTSILKPKLRVRTRRSPAIGPIGPSPLRSMILPDPVDGELSSYAQIRFTAENPGGEDRRMSVPSPRGVLRVGDVGNSSVGVAKGTSIVPKANRWHSSISSGCASKIDEDDPNVLLGIIRELVEETSEWDPSGVFMNSSFKNLLQESGITPTKSARGGFVGAEADTEHKSNGEQSTRSAEVDLGLLGLDIFKSGSFYDGRSSKTNSTNLVSFWDEDSGERYEFDSKILNVAKSYPVAARLSGWRGNSSPDFFSVLPTPAWFNAIHFLSSPRLNSPAWQVWLTCLEYLR